MQHQYRQKTKIKHADLPSMQPPASVTKVHCPSCAEEVPSADLNIVDMIGKCQCCNSVFSVRDTLTQLHITDDDLYTDEIGRPEGIELNYFHEELEITAKQEFPVLDLILACISPFMVLVGLGIFVGEGALAGLYLMIASMLILGYSIYKLVRSKKNRIYISINEDRIKVQHRPKNFISDKQFDTRQIEQVFVKLDPKLGGYGVNLVMNGADGQKQTKLLGGIKSELKAKYLEQEIERHLGISDKKVIGELQ